MAIACAAIKDRSGKIWIGKRHNDIIWLMSRFGIDSNGLDAQGFVDTKGNFLNRKDAYQIALKNKQIEKGTQPYEVLYSDDLY